MHIPALSPLSTRPADYQERRRRLARLLPPGTPVLLASGELQSRNYPSNHYDFRACSHYLYFCGWNQPGCAALLLDGECTFFYRVPGLEEAVWDGPPPDPEALKERFGFTRLANLSDLVVSPSTMLGGSVAATLAQRAFEPNGQDTQWVDAILELRLSHDAAAQRQLRDAGALTVAAHQAGRKAIAAGSSESVVLAAMIGTVIGGGGLPSFHPIVSVHGETLHNPYCGGMMNSGDLLLIDFGAENSEGWAGDVTRTHPVSGQMDEFQSRIYQAVLRCNQVGIEKCQIGAEFRQIHEAAALSLTESLVALGLLKGEASSLVERGAHTLFFPHGLGHLLGLDVHDMEDLGDRAGYAPGRKRSTQFGTNALRLDQPLREGMCVTIEPGFYWIPALLDNAEKTAPYADCLNLKEIRAYRGVRGIRIEDDVLVTAAGPEVLTAALEK